MHVGMWLLCKKIITQITFFIYESQSPKADQKRSKKNINQLKNNYQGLLVEWERKKEKKNCLSSSSTPSQIDLLIFP